LPLVPVDCCPVVVVVEVVVLVEVDVLVDDDGGGVLEVVVGVVVDVDVWDVLVGAVLAGGGVLLCPGCPNSAPTVVRWPLPEVAWPPSSSTPVNAPMPSTKAAATAATTIGHRRLPGSSLGGATASRTVSASCDAPTGGSSVLIRAVTRLRAA
jgi:hypothetical protein